MYDPERVLKFEHTPLILKGGSHAAHEKAPGIYHGAGGIEEVGAVESPTSLKRYVVRITDLFLLYPSSTRRGPRS